LRLRGHEVEELSGRDGDIAEPATLSRVGQVRHVFHLAGRTFVPDSWKDPLGFQRVNVLGTANVLEFCREHGARLTFVSAYLYGVPERLPVSEACVPRPNNPYALSKHMAEQVCAFYAAHHGIDVTVIRPFNIFGPGQKAHFLIPQIVGQVRQRQTVHVKDLAPRRDFIYIDDLVDAVVKTLRGPSGYNVFNIGSGSSLSVRELIAAIQSVAGTELPVISEAEVRSNEIDDVYADTSKAQGLLGWTPNITFQQGIEKMILEEANS
jgi:nucleoside-diphosphate-sugar epimerase